MRTKNAVMPLALSAALVVCLCTCSEILSPPNKVLNKKQAAALAAQREPDLVPLALKAGVDQLHMYYGPHYANIDLGMAAAGGPEGITAKTTALLPPLRFI